MFEFLMDGVGCIFSVQEIAYALDSQEEFVKEQLESLIKKLGNKNKIPIKSYYFEETLNGMIEMESGAEASLFVFSEMNMEQKYMLQETQKFNELRSHFHQ